MKDKKCPYCDKVISGENQGVIDYNFSKHLKKHKLRKDKEKNNKK